MVNSGGAGIDGGAGNGLPTSYIVKFWMSTVENRFWEECEAMLDRHHAVQKARGGDNGCDSDGYI